MLRFLPAISFILAQFWSPLSWAQNMAEGGYRPYTPPSPANEITVPLFVVLAYAAIWLVTLLFVWSIWHRQQKLEKALSDLRRQ